MKLQHKIRLADFYNKSDTTIIVASFPGKTNRSIKAIDAVASYTDHLTGALRRQLAKSGKKLVILAQKTEDGEDWYEEKGMLIARVWNKGSPFAYVQLLTTLGFYFTQVASVMVQFEFHQFGGNTTTGTFPFFLSGLKLLRKNISLVMHQVVEDIGDLSGHLNIAPHTLRAQLFNTALAIFYKSAAVLADTLIVHNKILADRFARITGRTDAIIVPHGLGALKQKYSKKQARKLLGFKQKDFVVMNFGFLAWYKGTDWLIHQFAEQKRKHIRLVIAGGESPNLKGTNHYQRFVTSLREEAEEHNNITITGFVEDRDIAPYFAAADLVVLPYRTLMSSSGPLAMTIAFQKPFIFSQALAPYLKDADMQRVLNITNLSAKDLSFALSGKSFWQTIRKAKASLRRYTQFSKLLFASRDWPTVATQFERACEQRRLAAEEKFAIMHKGTFVPYAHA